MCFIFQTLCIPLKNAVEEWCVIEEMYKIHAMILWLILIEHTPIHRFQSYPQPQKKP